MSQPVTESTSRATQRRLPLLAPLILLGLVIASWPLVVRSLSRLSDSLAYVYPNDGLEGTLLHEARLVAAGEPLYRPLTRLEFVSAPYPPLHTALVALFDRILVGAHPFWGGRLVSATAAIALALLIILIVQIVGRSWLAGTLGAALFFSAPAVLLWGSRIKPDMLAICFALAGLLCALVAVGNHPQILQDRSTGEPSASDTGQHTDRRSPVLSPWLIGAAVWFTIAFFTRQTTLMAAFSVCVALVLEDVLIWRSGVRAGFIGRLPLRWRSFWFGMLLVGLMLSVWALADAITGGQYTAHVWGLHKSEWWSMYLVLKYAQRLAPYWPALILALPLLSWAVHDVRARMLACYVLIAPITLIGAAEISANHNHMLESHVAIGLACGMAAAWAVRQLAAVPSQRNTALRIIVFIILALQLQMAYQPQKIFEGEFTPSDPPERFVHFIQNTPGEILADDVGLLIAGNKPVRYDDPSTMGPAARWGIWDQSGLIDEIGQRKFSAIMLRDDVENDPYDSVGRWTTEMRAAIREHYLLKFNDKIRVYVPKE